MKIRLALAISVLLLGAVACTATSQSDLSGMSFSDEPLTGKIIWNDLVTEDFDAAQRFYSGLFGWSSSGRGRSKAMTMSLLATAKPTWRVFSGSMHARTESGFQDGCRTCLSRMSMMRLHAACRAVRRLQYQRAM